MNEQLKEILEVNQMTVKELNKAARTQVRKSKKGDRERFIFALSKYGLKIPYHQRPVCKECGIRFKPYKFRQDRCYECYPAIPNTVVTLSPEDCIELGMSWDRANEYLELPQSYREGYESQLVQSL